MLELFDAFDIPIEAQMNLAVYEHCPDIPKALRQRGDEILGHGLTNSDMQEHLDEAAEAALIAEVTETIARHEGSRPAGWMSPWLSNSALTPAPAAGGGLSLLHGLDLRRPADLDDDARGPHPGDALPGPSATTPAASSGTATPPASSWTC